MTAVQTAAPDLTDVAPAKRWGDVVYLARIADDGLVHVVRARVVRRADAYGPTGYVYLDALSDTIGRVAPGTAWGYRDADELLRMSGWRRSGNWSIHKRQPACTVRPLTVWP